jgi:predicted oxidoreductase
MVYGTWRLLATKPTAKEINRRLHVCRDLGITTIDTAEIYGLYEVEKLLGEAIGLSPGLRGQIEIVTKAGIYVPCRQHPERRTAHYNATGEQLVRGLEKSLRLLGTDHVDLFLVHRPDWLARADDTAS